MTREEKGQIIDVLAEKFSQHNHFYITDASGFSVGQINAFRRICFNKGVEYRVYKNTLIRKALEKRGGNYDPIYKVLHGFSGVIFSKESGNAPARAIKEYRKRTKGSLPSKQLLSKPICLSERKTSICSTISSLRMSLLEKLFQCCNRLRRMYCLPF